MRVSIIATSIRNNLGKCGDAAVSKLFSLKREGSRSVLASGTAISETFSGARPERLLLETL
jgi:hypothetical protein